jgi:predicted DNA-binding WGR domain protein
LTSVEADKNRRRFYELRWEQDLFNGPVLVRKFGRLGTEGRSLARVYPDQESAQKEIQKLIRLRLRHGYQLAG